MHMKTLSSISLILILFTSTHPVFAQCKASFTHSVNNATKTVTYTNTSTKSNTYKWYFGDGTSSTAKNPVHVYSKSGRYNAILVSADTLNNCIDSTGTWVEVGCVSEGSIIWSQGKKLHYFIHKPGAYKLRFDFGDGNSSATDTGNYTYTNYGTYNVCLTVYCSPTDSSKTCEWIKIKNEACKAAFYFTNSDSFNLATFNFHNYSGTSSSMKYYWEFGDGNTSKAMNPIHTYKTLGRMYNVCLFTRDTITNCKDTICRNVYATNRCDSIFYAISRFDTLFYFYKSNAASVKWDFGDGTTSLSKNGYHVYSALGSYKLCLTAFCVPNDSSKLCQNITLSSVPCKAQFTKSIDTSIKFKLFLLNNSTTNSTNTYFWDFGDGDTSTIRNPTHKYKSFGKFLVCLTIRDGACYSNYCDTIGLDSSGKLFKNKSFEVVVIEQAASIQSKMQNADYKIYPNPANNQVNIDLSNSMVSYEKLEVLDAIGQVCYMQKIENGNKLLTVELRGINKGLYFIKLSNAHVYSFMKLIKN